jgi:hypothetical protein
VIDPDRPYYESLAAADAARRDRALRAGLGAMGA